MPVLTDSPAYQPKSLPFEADQGFEQPARVFRVEEREANAMIVTLIMALFIGGKQNLAKYYSI